MQRRSLVAAATAMPALLPLMALPSRSRAQPLAAEQQWFIFLETGRPVPEDKAAVAAMQAGHLENFKRLFADGKLFAAGPMRDPMTPQPHEPDINALVRACDVHDVACATNVASGRLMLRSLQVLGAAGGGRE